MNIESPDFALDVTGWQWDSIGVHATCHLAWYKLNAAGEREGFIIYMSHDQLVELSKTIDNALKEA